jgi:hypothetical protein
MTAAHAPPMNANIVFILSSPANVAFTRAVCRVAVQRLVMPWFLFRSFASRDGAQGIGLFTMVVGAIGIIVPLLVLMGNSSANIQIAVLISGAIIFGCGSIATAIGTKKK